MQNFDVILPLIIENEGGKVNDPRDPGGKTNRGITQKTYDAQRKEMIEKKVKNIPKEKDVYDLTIQETRDFFQYQFIRYQADKIADPDTCYVYFDALINHGPVQATKFLQLACNVVPDCKFGPITIAAVNSIVDQRDIRRKMLNHRQKEYEQSKNYGIYGKGWTNRLNKIAQQVEKGIKNLYKNNNANQIVQQQQQVIYRPKKK